MAHRQHRMNSGQTSEGGVAAVDRALDIVRTVALHAEPMSLADLARATGFYKSTILRLMASLEKAAFIARRNDGRYCLGPYAHQLGRAYEATHHLVETVRPILLDLVGRGTESASLHVYHNSRFRQCLLRVDSRHSILDRIATGDLLPLDRGAAGRLIQTFHRQGARPSLSNVSALSMGERDPDCAAVASAVFGIGNELLGVISLSGPRERFTPAAIEAMSDLCLSAAAQATALLGGQYPSRQETALSA